jgi:type IV pilus assembly protein PilN
MYTLEINLLREREPPPTPVKVGKLVATAAPGEYQPAIFGAVGGVLVIAAVGLWGFWTQQQIQQLEARKSALQQETSTIANQQQQVTQIKQEIQKIDGNTQGLAAVFTTISRSWGATLADLRQRTPRDLQIKTIEQSGNTLTVGGTAANYEAVNDLLLQLKQSKLFVPDSLQIVEAKTEEMPLEVSAAAAAGQGAATPAAPQAQYSIQTITFSVQGDLSQTPATELVDQLQQLGGNGVLARLRLLQERGGLH